MSRISVALLAMILLSATMLVSCNVANGKKPARPNVLIITLDTTREDILGPFGNKEVKTPNLDALAKDSVLFDDCFTVIPSTNPSHVSIFTSLYAKDHGVLSNYDKLPEYPEIMPKVFKAAGYVTAGFTSTSHLGRSYGFNQGYESFFDTIEEKRPAGDTNKFVLDWLGKISGKNFFAWVHYYDAHALYNPPAPYDKMYKNTSNEKVDFTEYWIKYKKPEFAEYFSKSDDPEYFRDLYKGEVSYMDSQLGAVIAKLKEERIYDNTLIVVVADHGESLGDHNVYFDHTHVYDSVLRVPLMFKLPKQTSTGMRKQLVTTLDIYPTVMEAAGIGYKGRIRGLSLAGIIKDPASPELHKAINSESTYRLIEVIHNNNYCYINRLFDRVNGHTVPLIPAQEELYDMVNDPGQRNNIAEKDRNVTAKLEEKLNAFVSDVWSHESAGKIRDEEQIKKLKSLGYVN